MNYESITAPNSPYHNGLLCWGSLTIDIASTKKLALVICNWHCSFCIAAKPNLGQLDFCIFLFLRRWWENMSRVEGSCSFRLWIPVHINIYMYLKSSKSHCTCAQNIQFSWSLHSRYVFFRFQLLCFIYGTKLVIWDCYTKFTKRKRKYVCVYKHHSSLGIHLLHQRLFLWLLSSFMLSFNVLTIFLCSQRAEARAFLRGLDFFLGAVSCKT